MSDAELRARALDAADDLARGLEPGLLLSSFEMARQAFDRSPVERTSYGLPRPDRPVPAHAQRELSRWHTTRLLDRLRGVPDLPECRSGEHDRSAAIVGAERASVVYERKLLERAGLLDCSETARFCRWAPFTAQAEAQRECVALGLAHWHGAHKIRRTAAGHVASRAAIPRYPAPDFSRFAEGGAA